ncbi:ATP-dependent DNA helicase PIF1 [Penicillium capsulatum]|uniref:ATP-dependent DNA helicase PIF1 n=1 Tax=Penicillium capsulatum TaxID=69766 RepID=A0A9W9HNM9_9EURO|nr:ATP-dependent DNA helicase PIF1 [Penicillium capsulatum]KAJ6112991.1 ATP-dependent DNA helicase PIF1 [Penicillium capsulatum]
MLPTRARSSELIRTIVLNRAKTPKNSAYSSAARPIEETAMFKKAVKDHPTPGGNAKPLQSNLLRANTMVSSKPAPAQSVGVKRKVETANGGESSLGSLHSAVYFDENDFDDDLDLDIDEPLPFTAPSAANTTKPDPVTYPNIDPPPLPGDKTQSDVNYPELPHHSQEDAAPPSSKPIPWSSSPPSHFQPPKPRTLPWLKEIKEQEPAQDKKGAFVTPKRPKQSEIWNKSASAIKEEQKELRREYKKNQQGDGALTLDPPAKPGKIFLSEEQKAVLNAVVDKGKSIFFTGSAGTGKSVLMREIIKGLRIKYKREPDRVAVTASTGLAACNIEGVTLHSFAGIGLGKEAVPELVKKIKKNQKARNRWLRTKVLVVDEVSMVDGDLFDKLEEIARKMRNNGRPFGGIQLVVTGDFFQLPPVPDGSNRDAKFAFAAATWNTAIQHTILLTHVFRQRDPEFASMLNEMRLGKITPQTIEAFRKLSRPLQFDDELEATELFPTRNEVENANSARMSRLSGEMMTFKAVDSGTIQDPQHREKLLSNCMAPQVMNLKKGAQVMLIKNMEDTLVNGSIGRVVAFMDEATFDIYRENEGAFAAGEGDPDDEDSGARARKKLKAMAHTEGGVTVTRKWPLVCFVQPDGSERHLLCQPEAWKIELPNGEVQAQRQQVPLILAWALSIHKAQGQTLPRVKVDLGRVFEKGQAYVALSRATSAAGLQVTRFEPRKVMVHPRVVDFYSNLVSIDQAIKPKKPRATEDFDDDCFD